MFIKFLKIYRQFKKTRKKCVNTKSDRLSSSFEFSSVIDRRCKDVSELFCVDIFSCKKKRRKKKVDICFGGRSVMYD